MLLENLLDLVAVNSKLAKPCVHLGFLLCGGCVALLLASEDDVLDALLDILNELFKVIFALEGLY